MGASACVYRPVSHLVPCLAPPPVSCPTPCLAPPHDLPHSCGLPHPLCPAPPHLFCPTTCVLPTPCVLSHPLCLVPPHAGIDSVLPQLDLCKVLDQDDYNALVWTSAAEAPGIILTLVILIFIGRKKVMALEFFALTGSTCLLFVCGGR